MSALPLDPNDPFPLLSETALSYAEARIHARAVDALLGLHCEEIEQELVLRGEIPVPGEQAWIGLGVDALQTPYTEFRQILARLDPLPGQRLVDLGAGYGRLGFVLCRHHPEVEFVGYELVRERVEDGSRALRAAGCTRARLLQADLASREFTPVSADFYFIYDFGTRDSIAKCLADLKRIARDRPITVIGRGRSSRDSIERQEPWLSQVLPPEHHDHFSIYRSG